MFEKARSLAEQPAWGISPYLVRVLVAVTILGIIGALADRLYGGRIPQTPGTVTATLLLIGGLLVVCFWR